ncbi:MAG: beta-glucosidase BglX [Alphaproteobacteria bacterium]
MNASTPATNKMNIFINDLMKKMTLQERIGQLNLVTSNIPLSAHIAGDVRKGSVGGMFGALVGGKFAMTGPEPLHEIQKMAVEESRLGIPLLLGYDVIHGHQTVFPIPLGLSCSWNLRHVETTARVGALEASANGLNWVFSPMVDIGRDARWGRIAEGSGEDPHLGSQIAAAMVKGYQGDDLSHPDNVMACVKHLGGYGAPEGGRDYNSIDMSARRFHEFYLPPFIAAIKAGVGSVMMSFSSVNGIPSHADEKMMRGFLRKQAGFTGLVASDFNAIPEMIQHGIGDARGGIDENPLQTVSAVSLKAGVQMDMMGWGFLTTLEKSLAEGKVSESLIDEACRAVLEAKYKLGLFEDPFNRFSAEKAARHIRAPEFHRAAREIAGDSCVLLKNDNDILPLKKADITIAVVGPLADDEDNILGPWSFGGFGGKAVSVLEGIRNVAGDCVNVIHAKGANIADDQRMVDLLNFAGPKVDIDARSPSDLIAEALVAAGKSDIVVAVLGEGAEMSGEAASRLDIGIPPSQRKLLEALAATGKPVVLVLMNGRPLTLQWEKENIPAILVTWFGGTEAGNAIADLLFGNRNPSGKLTTTFPAHVGQIPNSYYHLKTGRPGPKADPSKYTTRCYLDGTTAPSFPFGYGLSYTSFAYGPVTVDKTALKGNDTLKASVTVTNTGARAGEEVVQMYVTDPVASIAQPVKLLKGFQKISLQPGEEKTVTFAITPEDLKFTNAKLRRAWEAGQFIIGIGRNSDDLQTQPITWDKGPKTPARRARKSGQSLVSG